MKLHDRLPDALEQIANSITVEEPGLFDPIAAPVLAEAPPARRPLLVAAAAATIAVGGLGAIIAVAANRDDTTATTPAANDPASPATPASPTATANPAAAAVEAGPPGAFVAPASSGLVVDQAHQGDLAGATSIRWYAIDQAAPETTTYLRLISYHNAVPAGQRLACALDDARDLQLPDATAACIANRDPTEQIGRIAVDRSPYTVIIEGRASDDQLRTAAAHLVDTGTTNKFTIAAEGLPAGIAETGAGTNLSDFAHTGASPQPGQSSVMVGWSDDTGRLLFYAATADDPAMMTNLRLGYDTITDTTVRGVPGFIRTIASQPNYLGVVWTEDGLLYQAGSQGFTQAELLELLNQLRPATADQWATTVATQRTATADNVPATTTTIITTIPL